MLQLRAGQAYHEVVEDAIVDIELENDFVTMTGGKTNVPLVVEFH